LPVPISVDPPLFASYPAGNKIAANDVMDYLPRLRCPGSTHKIGWMDTGGFNRGIHRAGRYQFVAGLSVWNRVGYLSGVAAKGDTPGCGRGQLGEDLFVWRRVVGAA